MKTEPPLDLTLLASRIAELYGATVQSFTFWPEGECSVSYALDRRFFLKLWPNNRQGAAIRRRLGVILPLVEELYRRGMLPNLPPPIRTAEGALSAAFGEYTLALYPFVEGRPLSGPDEAASPVILAQIARSYASLHRAAALLRSPLPQDDAFAMDFVPDLLRGMARLEQPTGERPAVERLRQLLRPTGRIRAELADTLALREAAAAQPGPLVLCHTDMGGNNLLLRPDRHLVILDWDDVILAPPEHDLQEHRGPYFTALLQAYTRFGGISGLRTEQFAFYLKRRYLADLTDWLIRILEENSDPAQDEADLDGIEQYSLARLNGFDDEMRQIKQALSAARV